MSYSRFEITRKYLVLGLLGTVITAVTACEDSPPHPLAPPTDALESRGGSQGKPGIGEAVLFSGQDASGPDIFMMNPDGSNLHRVTRDSSLDESPDFAPDNKRFVFVRHMADSRSELFTAYTDGTKATQLTKMGAVVSSPRFSPDGTKIVFSAYTDEKYLGEIFVINADGTGLKRLTYEQYDDGAPTWSPDGLTIAWVTSREAEPAIYKMNSDGLDVRPVVTGCVAGCFDPAYSPGGHKFAYVDAADSVVWVIDLDAENPPVTVGPKLAGETRWPTWAKDDTQVLFSSNRGIEKSFEVYVGTPGKTDVLSVRRLTNFSPGDALMPAYSH